MFWLGTHKNAPTSWRTTDAEMCLCYTELKVTRFHKPTLIIIYENAFILYTSTYTIL